MSSISIFNIIALKDIFDIDPTLLNGTSITRADALKCGKKWRIKTKQALPLLDSDGIQLRELKVAINAFPTTEEPLTELEKIALSGLLYPYRAIWPEFVGDISVSAVIPFERGVYWLRQWANAEAPLMMPDPAGRFLKRLFDALKVDPLLSQMCSRVLFNHFGKQWTDIFEFNIQMHDMHGQLTARGITPCVSNDGIYSIYGVPKDLLPVGWNEDATRVFLHIAQKNIHHKK